MFLDRFAAYCASFVIAKAISGRVPNIRYISDPITVWYLSLLLGSTASVEGTEMYPAGRGVVAFLASFIPHCCSTVWR